METIGKIDLHLFYTCLMFKFMSIYGTKERKKNYRKFKKSRIILSRDTEEYE